MLGSSGSAEEALLKRCSHFDISQSTDSALQTCLNIVELRQQQLDECRQEAESMESRLQAEKAQLGEAVARKQEELADIEKEAERGIFPKDFVLRVPNLPA